MVEVLPMTSSVPKISAEPVRSFMVMVVVVGISRRYSVCFSRVWEVVDVGMEVVEGWWRDAWAGVGESSRPRPGRLKAIISEVVCCNQGAWTRLKPFLNSIFSLETDIVFSFRDQSRPLARSHVSANMVHKDRAGRIYNLRGGKKSIRHMRLVKALGKVTEWSEGRNYWLL